MRLIFVLPTRDSPQLQRHKQTENEGMEKIKRKPEWQNLRHSATPDKIDFKIKTVIRNQDTT